jgi:peptidoglycan-associated lipoprotein
MMKIGYLVLALGPLLLAGCGGDEALKQDAEVGMQPLQAETHGADDFAGSRGSTLGAPGSLNAPASSSSGRVIYFDFDSDEIKPEYRAVIEALAAYLSNHPTTVVALEGHADERGSREYNLALGERRAIAVQRQLGLMGAAEGRTSAVSYGEERPAASGHDEQSYSLNRRVELIY